MEKTPEIEIVPAAQPRPSKLFFAVIGIFIIAAVGAAGVVFRDNIPTLPSEEDEVSIEELPTAPYAFIYGYWLPDASVIRMYDMADNSDSLVASLPYNVKFVSVISPREILYIGGIPDDGDDVGDTLVVRDVVTDAETVIKHVSSGFGIDDYRVSDSGEYVAVWETQEGPEGVLYGGKSRVYGISLANPSSATLLYEEDITKPVHYPVAVTDSGQVFFDTFLPNSGLGFAYGMSTSKINGTGVQEISSMENGTYASQPVLSPDDDSLLFIGYDGSDGDGTEYVSGIRRALLAANSVETLDVATLGRTPLSVYGNENLYFRTSYLGQNTMDVLYDTGKGSVVDSLYDQNSDSLRAVELPHENSVLIAEMDDGKYLSGIKYVSSSALGNLSNEYTYSYSQIFLLDSAFEPLNLFSLDGTYIQYIAMKDSGYMDAVVKSSARNRDFELKNSEQQLQLKTFSLKQNLEPERVERQSDPRVPMEEIPGLPPILDLPKCQESPRIICEAQYPDAYENPESREALAQCIEATDTGETICGDSPLYLYGPEGLYVQVHSGVDVSNPSVSYNPLDGFLLQLENGGRMTVDGSIVSSIDFDYLPAVRVDMSTRGVVVEKGGLVQALREYSLKLGLNLRETADVVDYSKSITAPYVFISHFDQKTSKKILPLFFTPQPDNYYNIVFYIKEYEEKPKFSPTPPEFEKITDRSGFTAVEVSYIRE